jgi:hypothetical protein
MYTNASTLYRGSEYIIIYKDLCSVWKWDTWFGTVGYEYMYIIYNYESV